MARTLCGLAFATFFFFGSPPGYGQPVPFQAELDSIPYAERFDHAVAVLFDTTRMTDHRACIECILETSKELEKTEEAIEVLGAILNVSTLPEPIRHVAYYTHARLLHRSSEPEEKARARELFRKGIEAGWKADPDGTPFEPYKRSLYRNDPRMYVVEQFNRAQSDLTRRYYQEHQSFLQLLGVHRVWFTKKNGLFDFSAEDDILPQLDLEGAQDVHRAIAQSICLIVDERHQEAINLLEPLALRRPSASHQGSGPTQYFRNNEVLNITLYLAMAYVLQGADSEDTAWAIDDFLERNSHRPMYASSQLLRIAYALEGGPFATQGRLLEITTPLIAHNYHTHKKLPKAQRLHIVDMHMGGHFKAREWENARTFAEMVAAEYDSNLLACNNSLFCLSGAHMELGDAEAARSSLEPLLNNEAGGRWRRIAESRLVEIAINTNVPGSSPDLDEDLVRSLIVYSSPSEALQYDYQSLVEDFFRIKSFIEERTDDDEHR